jgi:hypothetical protein
MTIKELEFYLKLLNDYYGEDYIKDLQHLSEMMCLEFDIKISSEELMQITNTSTDVEDLMLTMNRCGVFY